MAFKDFLSDGGMKSRKLWLVVFTQLLITIMSVVALKFNMLEATFSTLVGGLISLATLYIAGNVGNKHVIGKQIIESKKNDTAKEPEPKEPLGDG